MVSIHELCSKALSRSLDDLLADLLASQATVIALMALTLLAACRVLFRWFLLPEDDKEKEWRLLMPFCVTSIIACALSCACWSLNIAALGTSYRNVKKEGSALCSNIFRDYIASFVSLTAFTVLYPLCVCAHAVCKFCIVDRLLRFNASEAALGAIVRWERLAVALLIVGCISLVACGIVACIWFYSVAQHLSMVQSSYTNSTARCSADDPNILKAIATMNIAFDRSSDMHTCEAAVLTLIVASFSVATYLCRQRLNSVHRKALSIARTFMLVFLAIVARFAYVVTNASSMRGNLNAQCGSCDSCQQPLYALKLWLDLTPWLEVSQSLHSSALIVCRSMAVDAR